MESFCFPTFLFVCGRGTRACGRDTLHDTERAGRGGADTGMLFRDDAAHTAGRRSADGAAVSGLCPHHDGVFLRGGEDRALLSLGVRGAGMHAASAAGTAAGARPQRRRLRGARRRRSHLLSRSLRNGEWTERYSAEIKKPPAADGTVPRGMDCLGTSYRRQRRKKEEGKESNQWVGADPLVTPSSTQRSGTARKRKKERI